jgi:acetyltransferase-like isoleucine patch superfamily enzyme
MIFPNVTLVTEGHPIEPAERYDFIAVAPIVIEANVWIGAAATILPGVTIGHDSRSSGPVPSSRRTSRPSRS